MFRSTGLIGRHCTIYHDYRIGEIRVEKGNEFVELRVPGGELYLKPGEAWGDVEPLAIQREMIRRTIKEHLDKEKRLRPQGIKVLSLFFIDAVEKYRKYDDDGNPVKGVYARIFEEEYKRAAHHPDYTSIQRILSGSLRLNDFKRNPQQFIELASQAINRCKRMALVDGIKYQRLGDEQFYAQELFEQEELTDT